MNGNCTFENSSISGNDFFIRSVRKALDILAASPYLGPSYTKIRKIYERDKCTYLLPYARGRLLLCSQNANLNELGLASVIFREVRRRDHYSRFRRAFDDEIEILVLEEQAEFLDTHQAKAEVRGRALAATVGHQMAAIQGLHINPCESQQFSYADQSTECKARENLVYHTGAMTPYNEQLEVYGDQTFTKTISQAIDRIKLAEKDMLFNLPVKIVQSNDSVSITDNGTAYVLLDWPVWKMAGQISLARYVFHELFVLTAQGCKEPQGLDSTSTFRSVECELAAIQESLNVLQQCDADEAEILRLSLLEDYMKWGGDIRIWLHWHRIVTALAG